jgi:hypothetical protein
MDLYKFIRYILNIKSTIITYIFYVNSLLNVHTFREIKKKKKKCYITLYNILQ